MSMLRMAIVTAVGIALAAACGLLVKSRAQAADSPSEKSSVVSPPAHTFALIHTPELEPVAREWAAYRASELGGGWRIVRHAVTKNSDADALRREIQSFIRAAHREAAPRNPADFMVLLLGDATSQSDSAAIPAWYFPQVDSVMRSGDGSNDQFASDHPYQLIDDGSDSPDLALGRVPARTVEEARAALAKIKRYEQPPTLESLAAANRTRITYVAGEGRFGAMDGVLEMLFKQMVDRLVPDAFDLSMTYAKASSIYCPPPSKLTETVLERLSSGGLLFNYIGHGFAKGFDSLHWRDKRFPILNVADLARQTAHESGDSSHRQLPIAFLSCCSVGWFDLPNGERSLAEEMLFNSGAGGAIAVISGSRITHPYANTAMQMHITRSLLVDRTPTIGLLDLQATRGMVKPGTMDRQLDAIATPIARMGKWESSLAELRRMHVKLYNLLGDPATRIALPQSQIANLKFDNGVVTGEVPGMKTGRVFITLETARTTFAKPDQVQIPAGENDPELEAKAVNNAALVNNRILTRSEAAVTGGKFSLALAQLLEPSVVLLRAYAVGSADGQTVDAAGALRLTPSVSPTASRSPE